MKDKKHDIVSAMQELAKWEHCNHGNNGSVNSFDHTIIKLAKRAAIPPQMVTVRGPDSLMISSYKWQIATSEWADHIFKDESFYKERRDSLRNKLNKGIGKPSATDGSKGQWRTALKARIFALDWLLGDLPSGVEVCIDCGKRQYPHGCDHDQTEVVDPRDYFNAVESGKSGRDAAKELLL